jgi:hypothetical protein
MMMSHKEMVALRAKLYDFYSTHDANVWMYSKQKALGDRVPVLCTVKEVEAVIEQRRL